MVSPKHEYKSNERCLNAYRRAVRAFVRVLLHVGITPTTYRLIDYCTLFFPYTKLERVLELGDRGRTQLER